jgi:hypothetical protein
MRNLCGHANRFAQRGVRVDGLAGGPGQHGGLWFKTPCASPSLCGRWGCERQLDSQEAGVRGHLLPRLCRLTPRQKAFSAYENATFILQGANLPETIFVMRS